MKPFPIPVIALSGPMKCGKTHISNHFKKLYPNWLQISYADGLRQVLEFVYGFKVSMQKLQSYKDSKQHSSGGVLSVREVQRHVANVGFRPLNELTWARFTDAVIEALYDPLNSNYSEFPVFKAYIDELCRQQHLDPHKDSVAGILIDDLRFKADCEHLIARGGHVVYIYEKEAETNFQKAVEKHNSTFHSLGRSLGWPSAFSLDRSELEILHVCDQSPSTFNNSVKLDTATKEELSQIAFFWSRQRTISIEKVSET